MKKYLMNIATIICLAIAATSITACGGDDDDEDEPKETTKYTYTVTASVTSDVVGSDASGNAKKNAEAEAEVVLNYVKALLGGVTEKQWVVYEEGSEEPYNTFCSVFADVNAWMISRQINLESASAYGSCHFKVSLKMTYKASGGTTESHTSTLEYNK